MIHSFTCENFYSIRDKVEVDFAVGDNAPTKTSYVKIPTDGRVSLVEAVIGANASGKTNVLKVLPFMRWLVVDAYTDDPDADLPVQPFGQSNKSKPTQLSVIFSIDERLFTYAFTMNPSRILSETLSERSKTTQRSTLKVLFSREWDDEKEDYKVNDKVFDIAHVKLRKNSSVVATAFRDKNPLATLIATYWRDGVSTNVAEAGYRNYPSAPHLHDRLANQAIQFFYDRPDLKDQVESILSRYDIGFNSFKKEEVQDTSFFSIHHDFEGGGFDLPLKYESSGTKQIIIILQYLLTALTRGGIAVIDELDANLHPEIVEEIVSMFSSNELNPKSAQLFFSSHTPTILSSLDKYQIIFIEKNGGGCTDVWRLDSVKGVRTDDNYYIKYIAGAYGAVPNLG